MLESNTVSAVFPLSLGTVEPLEPQLVDIPDSTTRLMIRARLKGRGETAKAEGAADTISFLQQLLVKPTYPGMLFMNPSKRRNNQRMWFNPQKNYRQKTVNGFLDSSRIVKVVSKWRQNLGFPVERPSQPGSVPPS